MQENKNNAVEKADNALGGAYSVNSGSILNGTDSRETPQGHVLDMQVTQNVAAKEQRDLEKLEKAIMDTKEQAERARAKVVLQRDKLRQKVIKQTERAQNKQQKITQKQERKQLKRKGESGNGGWIAAVISLAVAVLILAAALTVTYILPTEEQKALEATYQKSFYDTIEQVDNIDLNLSKTLATKDSQAVQGYLTDLAINSELAENDIQQLPLQDENKYYTTKLINQIGDFAKYLRKKLADGQSLSSKDKQDLLSLYQANLTLKNTLNTMAQEMGGDFSFEALAKGKTGNVVTKGFNDLQNLSTQYPELIYDGPFSDGINDREIKGLSGSDINQVQAVALFKEYFADFGLENVSAAGEVMGDIECYAVQATVKGDNLYAQISKKGGKLIMFAYSGSCKSVEIDSAKALMQAEKFLESAGVQSMKPVWVNLANNLYTINFAYEQDGVIVYSDLIKIRVCAQTGMVIGIEATGFYTNHVKRDTDKAKMSKNVAKTYVSEDIDIQTDRLCLIPIGTQAEILCYEFMGKADGTTYYVYIDANTGKQVEMFKVIEGSEGMLLM